MSVKVRIGTLERLGLILNTVFLLLLSIIMAFPMLNAIAISFSSGSAAEAGRVLVWPIGFQLGAWKYVAADASLIRSFLNSVYVTAAGTAASLIFTALIAYPLSKRYFRLRRFFSIVIVGVMVFRYPLIPYFLAVRSYGLMNNLNVLIITHLLTEYNLIIMRTFFEGIPPELEESAVIDGANHLQILTRIFLPVSKPVLATLGLFYAVLYWNLFMHPLLFLTKVELLPIQVRLRQFIAMSAEIGTQIGGFGAAIDIGPKNIESAVIVFGTLPIVLLYPFLQKYFVKGALIGSIKG